MYWSIDSRFSLLLVFLEYQIILDTVIAHGDRNDRWAQDMGLYAECGSGKVSYKLLLYM